jgi:hypothetical protein
VGPTGARRAHLRTPPSPPRQPSPEHDLLAFYQKGAPGPPPAPGPPLPGPPHRRARAAASRLRGSRAAPGERAERATAGPPPPVPRVDPRAPDTFLATFNTDVDGGAAIVLNVSRAAAPRGVDHFHRLVHTPSRLPPRPGWSSGVR